MKRPIRCMFLSTAAAAVLAVAGCATTGLSARETPNAGVNRYVFASAWTGGASSETWADPVAPVRTPAHIAVVQLGEVAPPQTVLESLRGEHALFSRVSALPDPSPSLQSMRSGQYTEEQVATHALAALRRAAAGMNADYLVVMGGTMDADQRRTGASAIDLTILGYFLVPTREHVVEGRAIASVFDVRTGHFVATATDSQSDRRFMTGYASGTAGQTSQQVKVRDRLLDNVAADVADAFRKSS